MIFCESAVSYIKCNLGDHIYIHTLKVEMDNELGGHGPAPEIEAHMYSWPSMARPT